jgi:hypothetical protein
MNHKELVALIENAKTREDHETLASYYHSEAVRLRARSKYHEEMADLNRNMPAGRNPALAKVPGQVAGHCEYFVKEYAKEAEEANALAALHYQMAKAAENSL